tara:strand:+ start:217 stop:942 length:726 start_codon:yes stop_codon:yes gene_type:complete
MMEIRTKIEIDDIDGYDWNWTEKYLDEFVEDLTKAYMASYDAEFPDAPLERASPILLDAVQREAAEWALLHGSKEIVDITNQTRLLVRRSVSTALTEGLPLAKIIRAIKDAPAFWPARAKVVARTETAYALGVGQLKAAEVQGRDEKHWVLAGITEDLNDRCPEYEGKGWIPIGQPFNDKGLQSVPAHPNCRCIVKYRTKRLHEESARRDFRCPGCNRLLARNAAKGIRIHCRHCKAERVA